MSDGPADEPPGSHAPRETPRETSPACRWTSSEGILLQAQRVLLHEESEAFARRERAVEDIGDAEEDRILEVLPVALHAVVDELLQRARRRHPLGDLRHRVEDLVDRLALADAVADHPIARERPKQVPKVSPTPERPKTVEDSPPVLVTSRRISPHPRVTSAAIAFVPSPRPSLIPAAIAMTFFTAPPISTPITSGV